MEEYSNEQLFYGAYRCGLEADMHFDDGDMDAYFLAVEEWHYWHDEIEKRDLLLAYNQYLENREFLG